MEIHVFQETQTTEGTTEGNTFINKSVRSSHQIMRQCSKCSEYKPLSSFYSQKNRNGSISLKQQCKECYNKSRKDKYNSDKEFRTKRAKQIQQYKSERESSDSEFYLRKHLSRRIRQTLVKQGESKILFNQYGIDVNSILLNIGERPSPDYHLDHIFPVSAFDFTDPFQVWACNHKDNLRWLDSKKNIEKSDKHSPEDLLKYLQEMKSEWDASRA